MPLIWMTRKGHTGKVNNVAFRPDGKRIVSGSEDDTMYNQLRRLLRRRSW